MAAMPRPDDRSDARERALYLLYEAYSEGITPVDALALQVLEPDELTVLLVTGVGEHVEQLDAAIAARAKGWTLARMPVLDLNVLRLGAGERVLVLDKVDKVGVIGVGAETPLNLPHEVLHHPIAELRPAPGPRPDQRRKQNGLAHLGAGLTAEQVIDQDRPAGALPT